MAMNPAPTAYFKVIHSNLGFGQFEASFNGPTGKSGSQQFLYGDITRTGHPVRDKILHLFGIQHVSGNDQAMSRTGQSIRSLFAVKRRPLGFPDDWPFFPFFNVKLFPALPLKCAGINKQIRHFRRRQCLGRKPWKVPFTASFTLFFGSRTKQYFRFPNPTGKIGRHFSHIGLPQSLKAIQKTPISAVPFIEGPGKYPDSIFQRTRNLSQGNIRFFAIDRFIGNPRLFSPIRVSGPAISAVSKK